LPILKAAVAVANTRTEAGLPTMAAFLDLYGPLRVTKNVNPVVDYRVGSGRVGCNWSVKIDMYL